MEPEDDFPGLICKVRAGDPQAAADLVRRYERAIRREARLRLTDPALRRIVDSVDVNQLVFGSFFVRAALGQFELDTPEQLLRLLMQMARHKIADELKKEKALRRGGDCRKEALPEDSQGGGEIRAPGGTPSECVAARDLLENALGKLSGEERQIADLRGQSYEWSEVAAQLGGTADGRRKQFARAVDRVASELGLEEVDDE